jgi:uncharacterized protein YdeI (YjbR/CyaY-like superfamily)
MVEIVPLIVADVAAWRAWLNVNEASNDGVWLVLAKKGTTEPTSLTYAQALDEALCSGWIDGQVKARDAATYVQRYTPRRARSVWSARNVGHITRLAEEGRMRERGRDEVRKAREDGRWDRAYAGPATAEVPDALARALAASPAARERFEGLSRSERYAILHPLLTAASEKTLKARVARAIAALEAPVRDEPG